MCAKSLQSCPTFCDPMNCSLPGSSVHGISQARLVECVAISSSRGLPNPRIQPEAPKSPALAGRFFTAEPPGKPQSSLGYQKLDLKTGQSPWDTDGPQPPDPATGRSGPWATLLGLDSLCCCYH